jgi:hypothetical protein
MLNLFRPLTNLLQADHIQTDSCIFRLHYQLTTFIFASASLLVTSKQFFGDPIDCIVDGVPTDFFDTFCWIQSTFTLPNVVSGFPLPGIGPQTDREEEVQHHKYYQWVCFVLFLQAVCFYIPKQLWEISENGKIQLLVQDLQAPILEEGKKLSQIENVARYWKQHRGKHVDYAIKYFCFETLNLVNVIGQIYFIDFFLGGQFKNYGIDVVNYSEMNSQERSDPMSKVFPKVTKCTFNKYGPSGTIEIKDGICVLPLNVINEKIFIFVWFWLIILAAVSGLHLIFRIVSMFAMFDVSMFDVSMFDVSIFAVRRFQAASIVRRCGSSIKRPNVERVLFPTSKTVSALQNYGDWFVLDLLVNNLDALTAGQIIQMIEEDLKGETRSDETSKIRAKV